jgi:hypothetical protein
LPESGKKIARHLSEKGKKKFESGWIKDEKNTDLPRLWGKMFAG